MGTTLLAPPVPANGRLSVCPSPQGPQKPTPCNPPLCTQNTAPYYKSDLASSQPALLVAPSVPHRLGPFCFFSIPFSFWPGATRARKNCPPAPFPCAPAPALCIPLYPCPHVIPSLEVTCSIVPAVARLRNGLGSQTECLAGLPSARPSLCSFRNICTAASLCLFAFLPYLPTGSDFHILVTPRVRPSSPSSFPLLLLPSLDI